MDTNHRQHGSSPPELSIVMPCLDEAETLALCIRKAFAGMKAAGVTGEVVVADNGSTDGSRDIAIAEGARVVAVSDKGYGNALRGGIREAAGKWILMGDADDSYDFSNIGAFIAKLREGHGLVMGCRMPSGGGRVLPGAMPWKHRWLGNPVLTFVGRLFFKCPSHDFHCGMRAFTREAYDTLNLQTEGMEFASEMVIKATLAGVGIAETPITLHKDGRSRPPHLRSWRDGWRHLRFMLLFSPRWLFLIPGFVMSGIGAAGLALLATGQFIFGRAVLDVGTMLVCSMVLLVGVQVVWFGLFTREYAVSEGLLPPNARLKKFLAAFSLEWGLITGLLLVVAGFALLGYAYLAWQRAGFHGLQYSENLRRIVPASTLVVLGIQCLFGSFFLGVLGMKSQKRTGK